MKRISVLAADIALSLAIFAWYLRGPWIDLYGFAVYHSRGDVWLPTPPLARAFLANMVVVEAGIFAAFFAAVTLLTFCLRRFPLRGAFYGGARALVAKYFALLMSAGSLPFALQWMRYHGTTREFYVSAGLAIALVGFILLMLIANLIVAGSAPREARAVTRKSV